MQNDELRVTIDTRRYDAVIFDMDGVVTDSAAVHAAAWTDLFDAFLAARPQLAGEDTTPFTLADYARWVDGKPRYDGVRDFLAARGITVPEGQPTDPPGTTTVCGLGNRKDELFLDRIARSGVPAFTSTVALVHQLREAGLGAAVFSASRNCAQVLAAAGIGDLFPVRVDGLVAEDLALPGKPDPAVLHEAARRLGADPDRTVVVEDSEAGATAGLRGGFGLVVGVDRIGHAAQLAAHGADVVVADLAAVGVVDGFPRMSELPDALGHHRRVADELGAGKTAVLLDFDGTLSEIVPDPASATLVAGAAATLKELAGQCPVAVVSGRDLDDLRERVGIDGIWYAGCHGMELQAPDGSRHTHDAGANAASSIARAAGELGPALAGIAGVVVEPKRFAVAVHHRRVAADRIGAVVATAHEIGERCGLRVTHGRKVTELRPDVDWDKGRAVEWILDQLTLPVVPVYIGDDLTDEDAFDAVAADGVPILVRHTENGDRCTAAEYGLDGPQRVREFLELLSRLLSGALPGISAESWTFGYDGYDPPAERLREALCTVGNGYLATRGAAPESVAGPAHYPGTYVAGLYNRLTDVVDAQLVDNESMVNLPNWLPVRWRLADGDWFDPDRAELLSYRQELDLRRAVLTRRLRYRDSDGRITGVVQQRFASMRSPHLCALRTILTAENWSGPLTIRTGIDTGVRNEGVQRYRELSGNHWAATEVVRAEPASIVVSARTSQSRIPVAVATRTTTSTAVESRAVEVDHLDGHDLVLDLESGASVTVDKIAAIFTGRDRAVSDPAQAALAAAGEAGTFAELLDAHTAAWEHLWSRLRMDIDGGLAGVRSVRLHLLHLVQTLSPHSADLDVGVPARGLHGEAYRGHIFWDELFVLPVLNVRFPAVGRALLRYRYRRLGEARNAARAIGCTGALFPWQSGSDGREESQRLHLNPRSGHWTPDASHLAQHAGLAVAFDVWQYQQVTDDRDFLVEVGAELLVEVARFWASRATYDHIDDRYHLRGLIGPDEFHTGYPGAPGTGIADNAYINVMAAWALGRARDALDLLAPRVRAELLEKLGVTADEQAHWAAVAKRLFVPFHDGVISQFGGYEQLAELDWDRYRREYGDIGRLDRILEAEGDDVDRYRVAKQADVLMLFYLLSADELRDVLGQLGYDLPAEMIPRTVDYYLARTTHGSTLSAVVHAWVLARANRDRALEFFGTVLESDITDIQGGTTPEGIHLAAMAGSVDLLQRCFTGLEVRADRLIFNPRWPRALGTLSFPITYRAHRLTVRIRTDSLEIASEPGDAAPVEIECQATVATLHPGSRIRVTLRGE
ncbi:trehalose-phosphatase [Nocardia stercoris]|uniref:Trehalose-phosphatase n=1 Tax=Nocardia stercoris TaxID=2483361 RepID=A0A3M2L7F4_9NOCA|nr:trehalose-phosphatase [Nocardia stercoris]RMI33559.1 trehalose-phosphatase [Nocardia stercoris]